MNVGLFDKVIKDATKSLQDAVNKKAEEAIESEVGKAVDETVDKIAEETTGKTVSEAAGAVSAGAAEASDELGSALKDLNSAIKDLNTAMAEAEEATKDITPEQWDQATSTLERMAMDKLKTMHLCLKCDKPFKGDLKFCPECGSRLTEKSVLELGQCTKCGKQNDLGAEFCTECSAKLPYKELLEEEERRKDELVLDRWRKELPWFPVWECGGKQFDLSELEEGRYYFSSWFDGDVSASKKSVQDYTRRLKENGFHTAGKYPGDQHLYKKIDGVVYHADLEHCFEGDEETPSFYFLINDEPTGGYDYVPPEPKKKPSGGGLFGSIFK